MAKAPVPSRTRVLFEGLHDRAGALQLEERPEGVLLRVAGTAVWRSWEPETKVDFDRATCMACALPGRGNVVAIYGDLDKTLVARGYLSPTDALMFAIALIRVTPP